MKQKGTEWITSDGKITQVRYLPKQEILFEKIAQKIAADAIILEKQLRDAKAYFTDLCKEAHRNAHDQHTKVRFTFFSFDREYRIDFDVKEENVRVYRATKPDPTMKDYESILLDLNRTKPSTEQTEQTPELFPTEDTNGQIINT